MNGFYFGDAILDLAAPEHMRDEIAGDLRERFARTRSLGGTSAALFGYLLDIATSVVPLCVTKVTTATRSQWAISLALGLAARAVTYVTLNAITKAHVPEAGLWFCYYGVLTAVTLALCLVPRKPMIGAVAVFALAIGLLQLIIVAATPMERSALVTPAFYIDYAQVVAAVIAASLIALRIRKIMRPELPV